MMAELSEQGERASVVYARKKNTMARISKVGHVVLAVRNPDPDGKRLELFFPTMGPDKVIEFLRRGQGGLEPYELTPAAVSQ